MHPYITIGAKILIIIVQIALISTTCLTYRIFINKTLKFNTIDIQSIIIFWFINSYLNGMWQTTQPIIKLKRIDTINSNFIPPLLVIYHYKSLLQKVHQQSEICYLQVSHIDPPNMARDHFLNNQYTETLL